MKMCIKIIKGNKFSTLLKNKMKPYFIYLIILFALILRLYFFVGIGITDDLKYVWAAYTLASGKFDNYPINIIDPLRSMMVLPLTLMFIIFGVNIYSAAIYPLLCSIANIFMTYKLGKMIFNENVGIIASFIFSIIPLDIVYSTQLIPSGPVTLFMLISTYLFLKGNRERKGEKRKRYLFLSGIAWGLAYLTNELAFFMPLIFLAFILSNFVISKKLNIDFRYVYIIYGFLIIILIEFSFFFIIKNDPLWRLKIVHHTEETIDTNIDYWYYPRILTKVINPNFEVQEGKIGIIFYMLLVSSFYLIKNRDKNSYFTILWISLILLYLEFGIMTLSFRTIAKWARYLIIILPPISIVIANFINKCKVFGTLLFLILILSMPYYIINVYNLHDTRVGDFKSIYFFLKNFEEKPIYTSFDSYPFLNFYFGYRRNIIPIENVESEDEIRDAFVVINDSIRIALDYTYRAKLPKFIIEPPSSWKLIKTIEGRKIGLYALFDPKIYYAPQ
ncbi:MAG: glycosyltransferase family 39 protein [Candidatus Aenigmatarchaeota archaeon]